MFVADGGGIHQGHSKKFWILVILGLLILMGIIFGQKSDEEKTQDAANLSAAKDLVLSRYTITPAFAILQPDPKTGFWFYTDSSPKCNHGMLSYDVDVLPLGQTSAKSVSMSWCLDLAGKAVEPVDTEARTYWAPISAPEQEPEQETPQQTGQRLTQQLEECREQGNCDQAIQEYKQELQKRQQHMLQDGTPY